MLGVVVNLATDLKTSWLAWLGVVVLTLVVAWVNVAVQRSSGEKLPPPTDSRGVSTTTNYYIGRAGKWTIAVELAVLLTAAVIIIYGARGRAPETPSPSTSPTGSPAAVSLPAAPSSAAAKPGFLQLGSQTQAYYPDNGVLPTTEPPPFKNHDSHCAAWADWAQSVKAAPTGNVFRIDALASTTSPITILDMKYTVYGKHPVNGHDRVQCEFGAGGFGGTTVFPDLDHPSRPVPMDTDNDMIPDTKLPGGFFVVDASKAEPLNIMMNGTPGLVYAYSVEFKVVENGEQETVQFGSRQQPLLLAFESDDAPGNGPRLGITSTGKYFDWDFATHAWAPTPQS
ncbi:hypothetical protein [Amycolatopsis vastitatis]|uniref:hypothetical protein n=1 Tax=Amycolatopsis vastitatis TaxID=1905142 RepID=UPI001177E23D|nr:hypothetical protein [Amycolatopsis vastitatis]